MATCHILALNVQQLPTLDTGKNDELYETNIRAGATESVDSNSERSASTIVLSCSSGTFRCGGLGKRKSSTESLNNSVNAEKTETNTGIPHPPKTKHNVFARERKNILRVLIPRLSCVQKTTEKLTQAAATATATTSTSTKWIEQSNVKIVEDRSKVDKKVTTKRRTPPKNKYTHDAKKLQDLLSENASLLEEQKKKLDAIKSEIYQHQMSLRTGSVQSTNQLAKLSKRQKKYENEIDEITDDLEELDEQYYVANFFGNPYLDYNVNTPPGHPSGFTHVPLVNCNLLERKRCVGTFNVRELIGVGSQGFVFKAHSRYHQKKQYAIKMYYKPQMMTSLTALVQLEMELTVLKDFPHKNIIEYVDVLHGVKNIYLVTKLANKDLQRLNKDFCFSRQNIWFILDGLVEALDHLHNFAKITHFDIKPGNILFDIATDNTETVGGGIVLHSEGVKLCDFGLSRYNSDAQKGMVGTRGTDGFYAPELLSPYGVALDGPLCDMWSLGACLLDLIGGLDDQWMLLYSSGDGGFSDPTNLQTLLQHHTDTIFSANHLFSGEEDQCLYDLIFKCLLVPAECRIPAQQALEHNFLISLFSPLEAHFVQTKEIR